MEREESSVGISDLIASFLQESLEETDGGVLEVHAMTWPSDLIAYPARSTT